MFLVLYNCYCQHRCDIVWSNENLDFHYDARNDIFISWNRNVKLFYLFYPPNFIVISIIIPLILLSDTLDWVSRWRPGSPLWTSSPSWRSSSSMSAWGSTRWNYKFWLALVSSSNELVEHWVHDSDHYHWSNLLRQSFRGPARWFGCKNWALISRHTKLISLMHSRFTT